MPSSSRSSLRPGTLTPLALVVMLALLGFLAFNAGTATPTPPQTSKLKRPARAPGARIATRAANPHPASITF